MVLSKGPWGKFSRALMVWTQNAATGSSSPSGLVNNQLVASARGPLTPARPEDESGQDD